MDTDTVLIILGVILLLVGIAGNIESEYFNVGLNNKVSRLFVGIVGAAFIVTYFTLTMDLASHFQKNIFALEIPPFKVSTDDEISKYLAMKTEKNLVEFFVNSGVTVISNRLPSKSSSNNHAFKLLGTVHNSTEGISSIEIELIDGYGHHISNTSINEESTSLKEKYKILPELLVYGLSIDEHSLKKITKSKVPTKSNIAYLYYLWAKKKYGEKKYDESIDSLKNAVKNDGDFAMAYWTGSEILSEQGRIEKARQWEETARSIDPDHPRWPYAPKDKTVNPVPRILAGLNSASEEIIDQAATKKEVYFESLSLQLVFVKLKASAYKFKIAKQYSAYGNGIDEFIRKNEAIFAINGGMYHSDHKQRLSPVGLFVVDSVTLQEASKNISGVFAVTKTGKPIIIPSNKLDNTTSYEYGIQSRPLLVDPGGLMGIYSNDYNRMNRSAVCMKGGYIVFAVVRGKNDSGLSLYEFAEVLQKKESDGGLECEVALNLDGGPSTQMAAEFGSYKAHLPGIWNIHNAITVTNAQ